MTKETAEKKIVEKLIVEALPNNDVEYIESVVVPDAVTHRAGFAALYEATEDAIPQEGNFMDWVRDGWSILHAALGEQKVEMKFIVAEENKVMAQFHYSVQHKGTFASAPATNKEVTWDEVGTFTFNDEGKIQEMWYMTEELKVAREIGYQLKLNK
ncbi:ester cyclase [Companilactobacillus nantensis]|uniref:SnoaL-like polyketide cyclase n=1 Tax=Companilactobacillus nantensis DSM 16982 TaxID=1423774 RepID=A0A0R1WMJ0_9LACO|nr:ester cyclase [Companilactobacillus nantensis]KRM18701.1 hypothetical protein FD31_GL000183 [Companilactobacillus nantensis DSM 16982]GEO63108.1 hypothetical protein LNA01_02910 [Companilactobacillus nantensis]